MANNYFEFKQFRINQDKTAMKVGTDGVLLGSIAKCHTSGNILDIGCGTGLITLMMAQRFPDSKITGIEPEVGAYEQALENVKNSNWAKRIEIQHESLTSFKPGSKFDCIVSNPPFYRNALKADIASRAKARQAESLPPEELLQFSQKNLSDDGSLWIIYPATDLQFFEKLMPDYSLNIQQIIFIKPTILKAAHRMILEIKKGSKTQTDVSMFCIEILQRHDYSEEYRELCKDFYLRF